MTSAFFFHNRRQLKSKKSVFKIKQKKIKTFFYFSKLLLNCKSKNFFFKHAFFFEVISNQRFFFVHISSLRFLQKLAFAQITCKLSKKNQIFLWLRSKYLINIKNQVFTQLPLFYFVECTIDDLFDFLC